MLIDFRPRRTSKIVRDELVWALLFIDEACLPRKKIRGQPLGIALPFELPAGIDNASLRRYLAPVIQPLPPIVQSPDSIQLIDGLEFLLQILHKPGLYVRVRSAARRSFVIDLPTDDRWIVLVVLKKFANDSLAIETVGCVGQIGVLAISVSDCLPAKSSYKDFRMFLVHPRWDGVGWSSHDYLDPLLLHALNESTHPGLLNCA